MLINNIAWILRRLPVFAIPGEGAYPVQPVHVEDLARICVQPARPTATLILTRPDPRRCPSTSLSSPSAAPSAPELADPARPAGGDGAAARLSACWSVTSS